MSLAAMRRNIRGRKEPNNSYREESQGRGQGGGNSGELNHGQGKAKKKKIADRQENRSNRINSSIPC